MTHQLPTRRGLAELDERLSEPERRCAQRLRDLRDRTGLSSEELAHRLRVDKTRLSKFLNGREVPRRELAARLHQVVAEQEGGEVSPEEVARTRKLMYDAVRTRNPLQAREFELADAREEIEHQRLRTNQQLDVLREELVAERRKRQAVEDSLADLSVHARDEVRALTEQRDAAERRVVEVEEEIRKAEALLRLQERDVRAMADLSNATDAELLLWDQAEAVGVDELYQVLVDWRDYDQDEQADQLMERLATSSDITLLFGLYEMFLGKGRKLDGQRILAATARSHDPVAVFYFTRTLEPSKGEEQPLTEFRVTRAQAPVSLVHLLNPSPAMQWVRDVVPAFVLHAPKESLLRFHRACGENGAADLGERLREHVLRDCPEGWNSGDRRETELYQLARIEEERRERELKYRRSWLARLLER
ncbi:helix-turn-helix domain-containing protein [Kitasatospora sp. NPDC059811]|uniref:helix-turn-helix domain-containing protein n=1 Tax=Streptomycetaceae TaxID=2062 RepID=UPI0007AFDDBF|nr:helix-turn-helix transcriptional regulator [Streptomyces sp. MJM8645]